MIDDAFWIQTSTLGYAVYPDVVPQSATYPCVIYQVISRPSLNGLDERLYAETARIQVTVLGELLHEVELISDKVIALWQGTTGDLDGLTNETINMCFLEEDSYSLDIDQDSTRSIYSCRFDVMIEILGTNP